MEHTSPTTRTPKRTRIGFGFDVHQLVPNRPLVLGGITIPSPVGCLGHSDADVLLHAVCDALLGALALGDIGQHFPDTDPSFKNADSSILLERCVALIHNQGYEVGNIDVTLVLESPKIMRYAPEMREKMASILQVSPSEVSIKATTNEKMGYIGRGEGCVAHAVAMLYPKA
jgi:2-C-methyl-D-erythritol 2,4-cyclodiphosphate synthase